MATGKLVAIVGPTASGKTALSLQLSQRFGGEIICADSRTIYRRADIGTAKPTAADRMLVPHHLLDLVEPGERFTAAQFRQLAEQMIGDIQSRVKIPFLVGGTGLYVDSVLYDYQFPAESDPKFRAELEALSTEELQRGVDEASIALNPSDYANRRRLIRALETAGQPRERAAKLREQTLVVGLAVNKAELQKRIGARVENMLSQGFLEEVSTLIKDYGSEVVVSLGNAYQAFAEVTGGAKNLDDAVAECVARDLDLAKRQLTWFKRDPHINWVNDAAEAERLVAEFIRKDN